MVPRVRAALESGVPPTAIILMDPTRREYGVWDLKLAAALTIHDNMMRGNVPIYWDESDRVAFDVKTGISKSRQKIDRREEEDSKSSKKLHGVYYYAVPRTIDGGPLPTPSEWMAEKAAKEGRSALR